MQILLESAKDEHGIKPVYITCLSLVPFLVLPHTISFQLHNSSAVLSADENRSQ